MRVERAPTAIRYRSVREKPNHAGQRPSESVSRRYRWLVGEPNEALAKTFRAATTEVTPTSSVEALASKRLAVAAVVVAAMFALMAILYQTAWYHGEDWMAPTLGWVGAASSVGLAVFAKRIPARAAVGVSIAYEASVCFAVFLFELAHLDGVAVTPQMSWSCLLIVSLPALVPMSSRAVLVGSVIAASTSLPALWIVTHSGDLELANSAVALSYLLPPYIAAAIAYLMARVISTLRADLRNARAVGPYDLLDRIGGGGMGEIWRARHRLLARPAAIKLTRSDGPVDSATRARFAFESRATAQLQSVNSIDIYDFGVTEDGTFYLVMELLEGVDLEKLVTEYGPQPPGRVVHLLGQVCDALDEAHRAGLLHRDIKPANIFLTVRANTLDVVKLLDFGLVRTIGCDREHPTTPQGLMGTPAYLPPEVARTECYGECHVDARADLYAVAAVGYFLLTGQLVFEVDSAMAMAVAHATEAPEPPSRRSKQVPAELDSLIVRCLSKSPDDRPSSAAALARELRAIELESWTHDDALTWWRTHRADLVADSVARSDAKAQS